MHCLSTVASLTSPQSWMAMLAVGGWIWYLDGGGAPAHSTAHASDIISHVTLIFESSRYVDCIQSASTLLPCNIPSFLLSVFFFANIQLPFPRLPCPTNYPPLAVRPLHSHLRLSIRTTIFAGAMDVFTLFRPVRKLMHLFQC